MSEKERMLNFQPLEAYVERQLGRGSEHGDSLQVASSLRARYATTGTDVADSAYQPTPSICDVWY
eukprot:1169663-Rhodomonas_salina.4